MHRQPHDPYRSDSGILTLFSVLIGLLFFGGYLAVERLALTALPPQLVAFLFLGAYAVIGLGFFLLYHIKAAKRRDEQTLFESLNTKMHSLFKYALDLPYAVTDEHGRIRVTNAALQKLLGAPDPFFKGSIEDICTGTTMQQIVSAISHREEKRSDQGVLTMEAIQAATDEAGAVTPTTVSPEQTSIVVSMKDKRYTVRAYEVNLNGRMNYLVTFTDVSELLALQEKFDRDLLAVAYIDVDNLEELAQYTRGMSYRDASRRVDDVLIGLAAELDGLLREYERDRYILLFSQEKLLLCEEQKFSNLLDRVRDIRLGEYNISVTVSVGISLADCSMAERAKEAQAALDMALQRGGDQVVVRRREGTKYYGGQTRPFQKRTKVQSRVVANYLLAKITEADNLLIMGHRNPDFDSIGACVGVAQMGLLAHVPTKIVVDTANANYRTATERLMDMPAYRDMFISGHRALGLIRSGTLLVIVDANNFKIIEAPDVAANVRQISGKIAIIDHHRQTGEYDFQPVLNYIDTSASSACELVTEMLEQSESGNEIEGFDLMNEEVANVVLSGITLDTNGFTRNTGSRTLAAAHYLYGKGANAEHVNSFFSENYEDYMCERSFSGCSLMHENTVGLTWSQGTGRPADDRVAAAKEADKLLGVRGVRASFALVAVGDTVHISGRSDGTVNVQLILERLGGGGRFDSAGTAMNGITLESAIEKLRTAVEEYFAESRGA